MTALGWKLDGPWSWVAPGGDVFAVPDELRSQAYMTSDFKKEVDRSIEARLWSAAAEFRNGGGLASGVDLK
eukprot:2462727-Pyramimonas_sp.AAC.1